MLPQLYFEESINIDIRTIRELLIKSVPLPLCLAMTGNGSNPKIWDNVPDIQDFDTVFVEPQCGIRRDYQAASSVPDDKLDQ